jgi:hypothetical protein
MKEYYVFKQSREATEMSIAAVHLKVSPQPLQRIAKSESREFGRFHTGTV